MTVRLDAVQPLLTALLAEPAPSLTLTGVDASTRLVWLGGKYALCYVVRTSENSNPKTLVLYVGDSDGSSGAYYTNVLGPAGNAAMPAGPQACINITVSRGLPVGPYTLVLQDAAGRAFASTSLAGQKATITAARTVFSTTSVSVAIAWSFPPGLATYQDAVWVLDSVGVVRYWFYTSCKCATTPKLAAAQNGTYTLKLSKPAVTGGYTFELHPRGVSAGGMMATTSIPWSKIGW
jgi:hypothetical protein